MFHVAKKSGFTLMELMIAMLVLSLFLVTVTSVYIRLVSAQRNANQTRKIYSEARYVMDVIRDEVRFLTIDWQCYKSFADCGFPNFEKVSGPVAILSLVDKKLAERVQFKVDAGRIRIRRQVRDVSGSWIPDRMHGFISDDFIDFGTQNVTVQAALFYISPRGDRLNNDSVHASQEHQGKTHPELDEFHYQPQVTFVIGFSSVSPDRKGGKIRFSLQTSVSSRGY